MNPEELMAEVKSMYKTLYSATELYLDAAQKVAEFDRDLRVQINYAVASGEITGKNQTERDAATQEQFANHFDELASLRNVETGYRTALDLARIQVEYIRTMVRLAEIGHANIS